MEQWGKTYTSDVDVYEALGTTHDPEEAVWGRVLETVPFAAKTILEIGCGTGHYARALAPTATSYIALDLSEAMLKAAKEHCAGTANITFLHADAQAIPLPDDAVDLVFGTWAIGAIWPPEAKERAMGEIHRVVRASGEIWAVENHWDSEFMAMRGAEEQEGDYQTWRWYESHGFSLVDVVKTAFAFPSVPEAERVLGFIFGEKALQYLAQHPNPRLGHRAIILRKVFADG
jgi:ubiquinone/menaquinone biosynthesis C-methylase UbiE